MMLIINLRTLDNLSKEHLCKNLASNHKKCHHQQIFLPKRIGDIAHLPDIHILQIHHTYLFEKIQNYFMTILPRIFSNKKKKTNTLALPIHEQKYCCEDQKLCLILD